MMLAEKFRMPTASEDDEADLIAFFLPLFFS
jgi:hypothetical protein